MTRETINVICTALLIGVLFFLSGYNNTKIRTLTNKVTQLETYHEERR
jgi:hypothetical protein